MNDSLDNFGFTLLLFCSSLVFFGLFFWLRRSTRNWHKTDGKIVNRKHALIPGNGPIVEYTDATGQIRQGETSRSAFYAPRSLRVRVSPEGKIHAKGTEWAAFVMGVFMLVFGIIALIFLP